MFTMNAANTEFVNSKNNPVRPWFERMIDQLAYNAHKDGLNFNDIDTHIVIHPELWQCIARLYSYGPYTKTGTDDEGIHIGESGTFYFVTHTELAPARHEEYLSRRALPICGGWYPVVLDSQMPLKSIRFYGQWYPVVLGSQVPKDKHFSGCIQNVNCNIRENVSKGCLDMGEFVRNKNIAHDQKPQSCPNCQWVGQVKDFLMQGTYDEKCPNCQWVRKIVPI